jgi:hypothetical protein
MIATLREHMMATGTISLRDRIATPPFWFVRKQTPRNAGLFSGRALNFSLLARNHLQRGCRYAEVRRSPAAFWRASERSRLPIFRQMVVGVNFAGASSLTRSLVVDDPFRRMQGLARHAVRYQKVAADTRNWQKARRHLFFAHTSSASRNTTTNKPQASCALSSMTARRCESALPARTQS